MQIRQVHGSNLLSAICSNQVLDAAFLHVRQARLNDNPHSDIWSLALNWATYRHEIREQLLAGRYRLSPITVYRSKQHGYLSRWTAQDAVVLKAIALCISPLIGEQVDARCYHLTSRSGLKGACRAVRAQLKDYTYVCKSDVAQFYDSMNYDVVIAHLSPVIEDNRILDLIHQYLTRVEIFQGHYRQIECSIPKGCPLSPLMGGLILKSLDDSIPAGCGYARYMHDWVILTKTRGQCRRVVKRMHVIMRRLKFKLAREKTFIGKISRGFDFLGYRFNAQGLIGLAAKTILNFIERISALYEQNASSRCIADYVRRWHGWCRAGL